FLHNLGVCVSGSAIVVCVCAAEFKKREELSVLKRQAIRYTRVLSLYVRTSGNILNYETCLNCNSGTGNSFTYDPIPESYDEVLNPPPQYQFNIYLCQICESNSHYGYECSQRVPLVYEPESCYTQNFNDNDYSHDLPGVNPLIDHHYCYE
nr:hypothetical protein [Tanacetum cinerariifolium]